MRVLAGVRTGVLCLGRNELVGRPERNARHDKHEDTAPQRPSEWEGHSWIIAPPGDGSQLLCLGSFSRAITIVSVYAAYSILLVFALVLSAPWWLLEALRHGKYRTGLRERMGTVPARLFHEAAASTIWIHAVSVGEVLAITRVAEQLKSARPGCRIVVSTTTDTAQRIARQRFGTDNVFYFPLDLRTFVRAYLHALKPKLLILAESEFWPNLLHEARRSGAAVAVVNARVSDRSLPRYLRFRGLLIRVMRNVQLFIAQSEEDARRLVAIGAPAERVQVSGNLKFEVQPPAHTEIVERLRSTIDRDEIGPVIVAGSTLDGEETMLIDAFAGVLAHHPRALLVLAPRHPERFESVANLLSASRIRFDRRSQWNEKDPIAGGVFLLDSIGELAGLYQLADVAFVGGSLVPHGGHNVLEAAQFGVAILVGPHTENFRDIIDVFRGSNALRVVTPSALSTTILHLLDDNAERQELGQRALAVVRSRQGATARTVEALLALLPSPSRQSGEPVVLERQV